MRWEVKDEEGDGGFWARGPAGVRFTWVKGHAKDEGNNAADELAVNGARVARELSEVRVLLEEEWRRDKRAVRLRKKVERAMVSTAD